MERVSIDHVELRLSQPDELAVRWIGSDELPRQLRAAWTVLADGDTWMSPRISGKPGVGKTTLAYTTARSLGRKVFIQQATMDTRPEDLIVQPVISPEGGIAYVASPIVSAMLSGGVAILDEANRMPEKSFASLASLLDDRHYVESVIAGVKIKAHADFRFAVTINTDASTYEIPEYIQSRLQPSIEVDWADPETERQILRFHVRHAPEELLERMVAYLSHAHQEDEPTSTRDGINILRYSEKLRRALPPEEADPAACFERARQMVLGNRRAGRRGMGAVEQGED